MKRVKIKDIFHTNAKTIKSSKYDFINYLDTSSITENHINGVQKLYLKADKIPSRAQRLIDKNTIVYSSVRPNLKHYGIIKKPLENMVVSTGFITLDIKDKTQNDANYMYYNLTQNKYTNYLHTIAVNSVSAYPSINPSDLENMEIKIHTDIKEQQKIGRILSSIDDKIAINNQINAILERVAKAIYEYYFVQFDFPDKQGKPYKSSGGAMRFDSTLNRPIPKDFEVILLKEMCDIESGYPFSTDDYANNGKYKIITIKNVLNNYISSDTDNTIDFIPKNMPNYCSLKIGDILLSLTGNVGRVGIVFENNLLLNQRVGLLKLKNQNYRSFVYLTFLQQHFKQILENIATGSNQKNLSPIETEKLPILFSQETIKEFESITKPLLDKIINNHTENQKLKNLRDFLLPILINAQVQI